MKQKIHALPDDCDFKLFAIASHLNDYKISWQINEELEFRLQQVEDLIVTDKKNLSEYKFSVFVYEDGPDSVFTLYANRSGNNTLLKSVKNADYILKYQGHMSNSQLVQFIDKLKKLKNILTVFQIDPAKLKQAEIEKFY